MIMRIITTTKSWTTTDTEMLVAVDTDLDGKFKDELARQKFKGKWGDVHLCYTPTGSNQRAVLFIGWQSEEEKRTLSSFENIAKYRKLGSLIAENAKRSNIEKVSLFSPRLEFNVESYCAALLEGLLLTQYSFEKYKSSKSTEKAWKLDTVIIHTKKKISAKSIEEVEQLCRATALARDLINTPANDCTPSYLVKIAREVAKEGGLKCEVFDRARLTKLKANSLLSVSKGSDEPPYLIKLVYKPIRPRSKKVIAIVGKGVTFDSGGLSIKTGAGMEGMKADMSGAAAVISAMQAIAQLKPRIEVRAYIPTTENMINGSATRPGDVVRAMNGKTIEILNTDAEGRLILADALALAERDTCDVIVDLATLTGACVVALGTDYAGLFTADDKLAKALMKAGDLSGEHLWRMPLAPEYKEWIKSSVADIKNIGKQWAGAITGALFLQHFVSSTVWAHLDIAGTASADADAGHIRKGGVGFGVRTLVRWIMGEGR